MGARAPEGWRLWVDPRSGIYHLRWREAGGGTRRVVSLRTQDGRRAAELAPQVYADHVSGRWRPTQRLGSAPAPLHELVGAWLEDYQAGRPGATAAACKLHWGAHLAPFFRNDLAKITRASIADYQAKRLREVTRSTLRKELSTLRVFLAWLVERGAIAAEHVPEVPKLRRGALGTPDEVRGRKGRTDLSPEQVAAILAALPESTPARKLDAVVWCRPFFEALYWTGLRPATLAALSVPEHWRPKAAHLDLPAELDKARMARRVPLAPEALAAIERAAPKKGGLIFGAHDLRNALETACKAAGAPVVTPYDLRHARATHLVEAGASLAGVGYLLGHARVTTTAIYARPSERAGEAALRVGRLGWGRDGDGPEKPGAKGGT
jgi:site-specific recombinase XerD